MATVGLVLLFPVSGHAQSVRDRLRQQRQEEFAPQEPGRTEEYVHEVRTLYYPNGKVKEESQYRDGKLHGKTLQYFEDGSLRAELNYQNGKLHGRCVWYFKNGEVSKEVQYDDGRIMDEGKPYTGIWVWNYDDGSVQSTWEVRNGLLNGIAKRYDRLGNLTETIYFKDSSRISEEEYRKHFSRN